MEVSILEVACLETDIGIDMLYLTPRPLGSPSCSGVLFCFPSLL